MIPSSENRIACSTKPAGPSFSIPLEMEPITQSEAGVDLPPGAILASHIDVDVLAGGEPIAQTTTKSVGRKVPDLIDLGKVFAAHAEDHVAGDATFQREAKLGPAGGRPVDGST